MHTAIALLAAEKAPPLIDIDGTVVVQLGIFLVLLIAMYGLLFKPYAKVRDDREKGIGGARAEAKAMEERATAIVVDYDQRLTKAKQRGAEERLKLRAEGQAHERTVLAEARELANREIEGARRKAASEQQAARAQLLAEAPVIGRAIAERILGRAV